LVVNLLPAMSTNYCSYAIADGIGESTCLSASNNKNRCLSNMSRSTTIARLAAVHSALVRDCFGDRIFMTATSVNDICEGEGIDSACSSR
jgi:hypothetical protein